MQLPIEFGHFAIEVHPGEYILKAPYPGFRIFSASIDLDSISMKKDITLQVGTGSGPIIRALSCGTEALLESNCSDATLTSPIPLKPLPPLKLHKHVAR